MHPAVGKPRGSITPMHRLKVKVEEGLSDTTMSASFFGLPENEVMHYIRYQKQCTFSAHSITLICACSPRIRRMRTVRHLPRRWTSCLPIVHTISGISETTRTPTTSSLFLLTLSPWKSFAVRCKALDRTNTSSTARWTSKSGTRYSPENSRCMRGRFCLILILGESKVRRIHLYLK